MSSILQDLFSKLSVTLDEEKEEKLNTFYEMLTEKNKVMNLTAITDYEDVCLKHFVDSYALNMVFDIGKMSKVIDIGTGAGFPGMVLAVFFPNVQFTLMDSLNKRINFLKEVSEKLGLTNVTCIHARAEELARMKDHREQYNLALSRAVANLSTLSEYCIPFVKKDGFFISYKAAGSDEEIRQADKAVSVLGAKRISTEKYILPDTDIERVYVIIKKTKQTPKVYPRKAGTPSSNPIK